MSKDNKRSTWIFGETVGNWFTRRLSEEFSSLSDSQKISAKGNPLIQRNGSVKKLFLTYRIFTLLKRRKHCILLQKVLDNGCHDILDTTATQCMKAERIVKMQKNITPA